MKRLINIILAILLGFTARIYYVVIYASSSKEVKQMINKDVINNLDQVWSKYKLGAILSLVLLLHLDKYYKTIFFHRTRKNVFSRIFSHENGLCFIIPYDVTLGANIKYDHPYGTILNAKYIGDNFRCKHLTTIGNKDDNENLRPTILNNVTLGANVTIIGSVTIGNNVVIGAGTIVTKDIPDNSIVIGSSHLRFLNT
ncbi:DapH/DapD/GlmU-related protein [uncultured Parabacteroides sp.]|mgnify:FL=1|jgi:serine acetyltransferase|uniref:DapH/DapD/GlmU-related protein n=1 Tax=uncultured Parabacteroides sp. TaxID=512312 RepID=UPI0025F1C3E2|nr:DapH/DapD/GlmU-related protein [uncultured Parabacteroides sp.]